MTKLPSRWNYSDPLARDLLRAGLPSRELPETSRMRGARRVARLASAPVVGLGIGLLSKAVAAGFGVGVVTATAVVIGVPAVRARIAALDVAPVEINVSPRSPVSSARSEPSEPKVLPEPAAEPAPPVAEVVKPASATPKRAAAAAPSRALPRSVAKPRESVATRKNEAPTDPPVERGISAEVAILLDARRMLETDPAQAIVLLAGHSGDFPVGELALEREVLMIEALDRADQRTESLRRAHELLARSPNAFYGARLRELILSIAAERARNTSSE